MSLQPENFIAKIESNEVEITVIGLGKMGLPIAMVFANQNFRVTGYDISTELVDQLNKGKTQLTSEPFVQERLVKAVENNNFKATNDIESAVENADIIIIIIPILDTPSGAQNLDVLKELYSQIVNYAKSDILIIQESTLAPGTSRNELWPILENKMKESNINLGLVFAPERTLSGRAILDIEDNYPKLVGGINEQDTKIASSLYEKVVKKGVIQLSSATAAEAVKTFKGAYRDANIAIANQFAIMADHYGVDILEVIDAANTEPYSHIHRPGIGVGGHCIPVYPKFLINTSGQLGYNPDLLVKSRQINDYMVDYAIKTLEEKYKEIENVLVLGLAYRNGVKEYRHSPALRLVPELRSKDYKVQVTDPLFSAEEIDHLFGKGTGVNYNEIDFEKYDTIIVNTDHNEFKELDHELVNKIIFDGRYIINTSIKGAKVYQPGRLNVNNS